MVATCQAPRLRAKKARMTTEKISLLPRTKLGKIRFACERWLYHHGFSNADARTLIAIQFMSAAVLLLAGLVFSWHTLWMLWVGAGAVLAVGNFYFVAQKIQAFFPNGFSRKQVIGLLLNFYLRLFITALLLFVFIVILAAPVSALLVGLSLSAAVAIIFGLTKLHTLRTKEASDNA